MFPGTMNNESMTARLYDLAVADAARVHVIAAHGLTDRIRAHARMVLRELRDATGDPRYSA